tara:strand:- start:6885 stop:7331 length:447 start_codon:yes stop_codon:yes gene_type:complete
MRDIVSGRVIKGIVGNRSERYLYRSNSDPMISSRGRILLRLWKERTSVKIGYSEAKHVTRIRDGLVKLIEIEKELDVDFEEMLTGVLDLYFSEHMKGFPSPSMFFSLTSGLCKEWHNGMFDVHPELDSSDELSINIDDDLFSIEIKSI